MEKNAVKYLTMALLMMVSVLPTPANTFTVTSTGNSGAGSLREALEDANSTAGADSILFDIPGTGPHTINLTSWLPAVTDRVFIDGYSQTGASRATDSTDAVLMIELNGSQAGADVGGLYFFTDSDSSRVSGLAINGFNRVGIYLLNPRGVKIDGNFIGLDVTGSSAVPNTDSGIQVQQTSSNGTIIGGNTPGERNVISGNTGDGISLVNCSYCVITGNYIGTDAAGASSVPNGGYGIRADGDHTTIGTAGSGNLISGNSQDGIYLEYSQHSTVVSNLIGLNATGSGSIPNGGHGINCSGDYTTIGGSSSALRNYISGNGKQGINLTGSTNNTITGNYIGTDTSGVNEVGNQWSGICMTASSNDNSIGGTGTGEGNLISGNMVFGIDIQGSSGAVVQGNLIGTNVLGTSQLRNHQTGISLSSGATSNTIGGTSPGARNIISGNNSCGVAINASTANTVSGNYIGTDISGSAPIGNGWGIYISGNSTGNLIGGGDEASRNLVSGNTYGIFISGCSGNTIHGNYIGTDATGMAPIPNDWDGIYLYDGGDGNYIGGTGAGEGNVISGNSHYGIRIQESKDNVIEGNRIGTTALGTGPLGNGGHGIFVDDGSPGNTVGGAEPDASNTIAFNAGAGVSVKSSTGNAILWNSIFSNDGGGIDLGDDGPTANDPDDPDQGANRLQNYPVITAVNETTSGLQVSCSVPSTPGNSSYPILLEFYISRGGQGKTFIGSGSYTSTGPAVITLTPEHPYQLSDSIVATATDSLRNTSEFSAAFHLGGVEGSETPEEFDLQIVGANPGRGVTVIGVSVPSQQYVEIEMYDISGRMVERLVDGPLSPGMHDITVVNLVPGVYFCRMETEGFRKTLELVITE